MIQKEIKIGEITIPIIEHDDKAYYPISYISKKILLRKGNIILKSNYEEYKEYVNVFQLDYTFAEGGIQNVKCISEEGLKKVLTKSKIDRLTMEQRSSMNILLEYLQMGKINEEEQFIVKLNKDKLKEYSLFLRDAIEDILNTNPNIKFQRCSKCNIYYPLHGNFYRKNLNSSKEFDTYCRDCNRWDENRSRDYIRRNDNYISKINFKYGEAVYKIFRKHDVLGIYSFYRDNLKSVPPMIKNKKDYIEIIKYLINKNKINLYDLNIKEINDDHGLQCIHKVLNLHDVYSALIGEDYYLKPWKFNSFIFKYIELNFEIANKVFGNYLKEFNIEAHDVLNIKYYDICQKAKIGNLTNGDILYFAVQYNNFKFAGYKYKIRTTNYYKNESNVIFDLKWLIENDLKVEESKVPLYLTKNVLQKKSQPLYHHIVTNKNGSIFEWVDKIYPNKFIEADFEINAYRNEFDSDTESFIHELLKSKFNNVVYNQKHSEKTITLDGMIPDWFVFTENGVWIVEYFGMYIERQKDTSSRINDYIDRTHEKIEKYKKMKNYNCIFLYRDDIDDDFLGCREKLKEIV
ncbi:hypothetical protein [Metabacillus fastidiosus]|uniref:hypothetical protein n=1 Tax=Metabacillus fastidiosus TaxID=1458 RepID=UPI003D26AD42